LQGSYKIRPSETHSYVRAPIPFWCKWTSHQSSCQWCFGLDPLFYYSPSRIDHNPRQKRQS